MPCVGGCPRRCALSCVWSVSVRESCCMTLCGWPEAGAARGGRWRLAGGWVGGDVRVGLVCAPFTAQSPTSQNQRPFTTPTPLLTTFSCPADGSAKRNNVTSCAAVKFAKVQDVLPAAVDFATMRRVSCFVPRLSPQQMFPKKRLPKKVVQQSTENGRTKKMTQPDPIPRLSSTPHATFSKAKTTFHNPAPPF